MSHNYAHLPTCTYALLSLAFSRSLVCSHPPFLLSKSCAQRERARRLGGGCGAIGEHRRRNSCETFRMCLLNSFISSTSIVYSMYMYIYLSVFLYLSSFSICLSLFSNFLSFYPSLSLSLSVATVSPPTNALCAELGQIEFNANS